MTMKKIFISFMMAAAMFAAASWACSNDSAKKAEKVECTAEKCAGGDKKDSCADAQGCSKDGGCSEEKCAGCDSTAVKDSCCRR